MVQRKPAPKQRTPPSVRHPSGLPRCQRIRRQPNGQWAQCKRAACWQLGASVCGVHGSGWPVRVWRGERQNPVTSSLRHGERASARTLDMVIGDPELEHRALGETVHRIIRGMKRRISARAAAFGDEVEEFSGRRKRGRPSKKEAAARKIRRRDYLLRRLLWDEVEKIMEGIKK